ARLFKITVENYSYLSRPQDWERFLDAARNVHGSRVEHLAQRVRSLNRERSLISARAEVKDPDLRFFLALLLNLPTRSWIYQLVQARSPDSKPEDMCCKWLALLCNEESLSGAFMELARKANLGSDLFRARLKV